AGTASDALPGRVAGVEVSVDGGATWHLAQGQTNWTYEWTPATLGPASVLARATDDSANVGTAAGTSVEVVPSVCPCTSLWNPLTAVPANLDAGGDTLELGVRFSSEQAGFITGLRFYKSTNNTGTHLGHLWSNTGTPL